jgi:hypothetical protein
VRSVFISPMRITTGRTSRQAILIPKVGFEMSLATELCRYSSGGSLLPVFVNS